MIKNDIVNLIKPVLESENLSTEKLRIENSSHADYSTSIAFHLGKLGDYQTSEQAAKYFVAKIPENDTFFEPKIVQPGFINFTLKPEYVFKKIQNIIEQENSYGESKSRSGQTARVEFVSANPTGPLHIGNARGGPLGDVLASVLEKVGFKVVREYYNNNIGTQVDIFGDSLIYYIKQKFGEKVSQVADGQSYSGSYLEELADKVVQTLKISSVSEIEQEKENIKANGIKILNAEIISTCKELGIEFDKIFNESEIQKNETQRVIGDFTKRGLTKEKEGAVWFAPGDEFLEDRESVLVRSDGRFTYFADDIAYHKIKVESDPDLIVNVLGSNHHGHVPRIQAAIKAMGFDLTKVKTILYQYVRVKRGNDIVKMSKRAGNFVTAEEVLTEVGKDAFRFFMLQHSPNTHMDFDLSLAKAKNESNPVFYVQYAHARICSILTKAQAVEGKANLNLLKEDQELALAKKLIQFPDLLSEISEGFQVHHLTYYALELADLFHKFYEKHRVITEDQELTKARLELTKAAKITLKNTLTLLGVSSPERM